MLVERISTNAGIVEQRSPSTLRKFMRIFGLGKASEEGQTGTATAAVTERGPRSEETFDRLRLPVVNEGTRVKDLVQVRSRSSDIDLLRERPADFYCLDMESEGIEPVAEWVHKAIHSALQEERRLPVIYVIGPRHALSDEEWEHVNNEITPSAYFFKRPNYNISFLDAMKSLRDGLAKQYAMLQRMEQRQVNKTVSAQTKSAAR